MIARAQRKSVVKSAVIQALFLAVVILGIWSAIQSAYENLTSIGVTSGFGFLDRSTGWSYSFSLFERSIDDSYRRTLFIGFSNTLFLGLVSIFLATLLGFLVGALRDSRNIAAQSAAALFVHIFRNIPLILQLVFWYAVLVRLPNPRNAEPLLDVAFLSNRGLMLPALNMDVVAAAVIALLAIALALGLRRMPRLSGPAATGLWVAGVFIGSIAIAALFAPAGESVFSIPELKGLRFVGGLTISVELLAMIISIVLYGSAYIAEVVRGGLQEVPKGLVEAGQSLGLTPRSVWMRIKMPMALRTIIPPLGNQWIFIMKATTIGVAIGFSDLFMIVSTSITQSGQTLELIGILMASFILINVALALIINAINAKLHLKGQ